MGITIRPATPDDAAFVAWIMLAAGRSHLDRGFWDHYVDGSEEECLAFLRLVALTASPHPFHHSIFMIAEEQGRPVAGLSGYDPATLGIEKYLEALPEVFEKVGWSDEDQGRAFNRITPFLTCIPDDAPGAWIVESVAAVPEVRRRGLTTKLLKEMIRKGRAGGFRRGQISVLIGNDPARLAYEKCGFSFAGEKRDPSFEATFGSPGITRLLMEFS